MCFQFHLNVVDIFKEFSTVIPYRQVIRAVQGELLLAHMTHLVISWNKTLKSYYTHSCNQQGKRTNVAPTRSGRLAKLVYPVYCTILSLWVYVTETVWLELKCKTCSLTELSFFSHLGLVDDISQDLLFLNELVLVQHLLLP